MRQIILLFIVLIIALNTTAQITITVADYPMNIAANADNISEFTNVNIVGTALPQQGQNMVWDYSNISTSNNFMNTYNFSSNAPIPNSNFKKTTTYRLAFTPFSFLGVNYYNYDATGFSQTGFETFLDTVTLGYITGNFNDSLYLLGSNYINNPPIYDIKFPCNFGDFDDFTVQDTFKYQATINSLNFDKKQINEVRTKSVLYDVHSYGILVLTNPGTMANDSFEVLVRTNTTTTQINYYDTLGYPYSSTVLSILGMYQGGSSEEKRHTFYVKGLTDYAFELVESYGVLISSSLNLDIFDMQTVNTTSKQPVLIEHKIYPNPVQNHRFQLQFEKNADEECTFEVININGQTVHQTFFPKGETTIQNTIPLNQSLPKGMYFYAIRNEVGVVIANGRFLLQ